MSRQEACQPCDQFTADDGRPCCRLMRCCGSPDRWSPVEYARRLAYPRATCPLGWWDDLPAGATVPAGEPLAFRRARICLGRIGGRCPDYLGGGRCRHLADLNAALADPAAACPIRRWASEVA